MAISHLLYEKIGISQQALGAIIGAKQSTLSHHDNDTRDLPSAASMALNDLVLIALKLEQAALPTSTESDKEKLQKAAQWCTMQCHPLQKKLNKMLLHQQQAVNMLAFIECYKQTHTEISNKVANWLEIMRIDAEKKLVKNSWLAIKTLEIQIQVLRQQATMYEAASEK